MDNLQKKVTGGTPVRERRARPVWQINLDNDNNPEYYEDVFRSAIIKLANEGAVKIDGSVMLEFTHKRSLNDGKLISSDTMFAFHQIAEQHNNDDNNRQKKLDNALSGYNYQKTASKFVNDNSFMPVI